MSKDKHFCEYNKIIFEGSLKITTSLFLNGNYYIKM